MLLHKSEDYKRRRVWMCILYIQARLYWLLLPPHGGSTDRARLALTGSKEHPGVWLGCRLCRLSDECFTHRAPGGPRYYGTVGRIHSD